MREIKFRGLTLNGEMVHGLLSHSQGYNTQPKEGFYISNKCGMPWAYSVRPETISQYIGLKDKNGKDIYEGDIINGGGWTREIYIVRYNQWNCQYHGEMKNGNIYYMVENEKKCREVIGNIHENKELSKEIINE